MRKIGFVAVAFAAFALPLSAAEGNKKPAEIIDGTHGYIPENYVQTDDPLVLEELEKFKDRKLGLMMHFGIYSQLGIHESWPLVDAAYAIRLWKEGERRILRIVVPNDFDNAAVRRVVHLASGTEITFERTSDGLLLRLPETLEADEYADAFVVSR